jgi:hypothetical protein
MERERRKNLIESTQQEASGSTHPPKSHVLNVPDPPWSSQGREARLKRLEDLWARRQAKIRTGAAPDSLFTHLLPRRARSNDLPAGPGATARSDDFLADLEATVGADDLSASPKATTGSDDFPAGPEAACGSGDVSAGSEAAGEPDDVFAGPEATGGFDDVLADPEAPDGSDDGTEAAQDAEANGGEDIVRVSFCAVVSFALISGSRSFFP